MPISPLTFLPLADERLPLLSGDLREAKHRSTGGKHRITTSSYKLNGEVAYRVRRGGKRVGTVIRELDGTWRAYTARTGQYVYSAPTRAQAASLLV